MFGQQNTSTVTGQITANKPGGIGGIFNNNTPTSQNQPSSNPTAQNTTTGGNIFTNQNKPT